MALKQVPPERVEEYRKKAERIEEKKRIEQNNNLNNNRNIRKDGDYFVIENIKLYDLDGEIHTEYPEVRIDAYPANKDYQLITNDQNDWVSYYTDKKKKLPSFPMVYAILEACYENKDKPAVKDLLQSLKKDFKTDWLLTSTRFNYDDDKIWHNYRTSEQIEFYEIHIPGKGDYLENIVTLPDWEKPLRGIFMANDIEKIPKVFGLYGKRKGYLWTSNDNRNIERAAFVGFNNGLFYGYGTSTLGRSRGVIAEPHRAKSKNIWQFVRTIP